MHLSGTIRYAAALGLIIVGIVAAMEAPAPAQTPPVDGGHDFDFILGKWNIQLRRLERPLSGSTTWLDFRGSVVARPLWDGRANIEEFTVVGPTGRVEGLTLRLYNPDSSQWSLYWANRNGGAIGGPPNVGVFKDGRGEFFAQDTFNGRTILIRYVWSGITPTSAHFEQSFSDDGGKSWEVNWITDQTRAKESAAVPVVQSPDGQHDFDFEFGRWKTQLRRLVRPLTGSTTWVEYTGTTVVTKVWDGRANLVELDVQGPAGRIEGLSLRLYNPASRQWSLNFASKAGGTLTPPTIGHFVHGRGEFFGMDTVEGRVVLVRFVIAPLTPSSWRFEQAFSTDGGQSWEVNWIATDTRED